MDVLITLYLDITVFHSSNSSTLKIHNTVDFIIYIIYKCNIYIKLGLFIPIIYRKFVYIFLYIRN